MDESFYRFAMKLFSEAGHADASLPVFVNHSPEQVVYFDNKDSVSLSKRQREELKNFQNVSYLFTLGDELFDNNSQHQIVFYSLELICRNSMRSQVAYDVHMLLYPIIGSEATVLLCKHEDKVLLSLAGYQQESILSDWYSIEGDYEDFVEKLHIANVSLKSAREYFFDLVYSTAREYYTYSVSSEMTMYSLLPIDYFSRNEDGFIDREEIRDLIMNVLNSYLYEYGDDYVEQERYSLAKERALNVGAELDLMLLGMEDDENDNPFGEELDDVDEYFEVDEYSEELEHEETEKDKYEFDEINPEIFKDPTLMVKWLEKNITQEN